MAIEDNVKTCTVVLHDDAVSNEDVLCGANVLASGEVAYLTGPGSKALCIRCTKQSPNSDEVSIHVSIAKCFGLENRTKGSVRIVEDVEQATATHAELLFRDQHLSRADMWRIQSQIDTKVLYESQEIRYLGSVAATVEAVFIAGQQVHSALVAHPQTKLIFRSISARFTFLIQISKEMLENWQGTDLMYETMIDGFIPDLFKRWDQLKARHMVSVVLYGRRLRPSNKPKPSDEASIGEPEHFFHPLMLAAPSSGWRELRRKLKKAFNSSSLPRNVSLAANGNTIEAIHLAAMDFANSSDDIHLGHTGTSIVIITAGSGLFDGDYEVLKSTTKLLMGSSTGVDLVCLSTKPLHPVPLFKYSKSGETAYALPHWFDISFWTGDQSVQGSRWLFNDEAGAMNSIQIPKLKCDPRLPETASIEAQMEAADQEAFCADRAGQAEVPNMGSRLVITRVASTPNGEMKHTSEVVSNDTKGSAQFHSTKTGDKHGSKEKPTEPEVMAKKSKKDAIAPHPLMQTDRKISFGPRGSAPTLSVASTSVSAQPLQQDKSVASTSPFTANAATSGLAKQIKDSLRRKPSQQSLASHTPQENTPSSRPVDIQNDEVNKAGGSRDPASLVEEVLMKPMSQSVGEDTDSISGTPRPKSPTFSAEMPIDKQNHIEALWLMLRNPCNPRRDNMIVASEYRQWQNVFPKAVSSAVFKWKSMCSPAALPLIAEGRFSLRDLEKHFSKQVRRYLAAPSTTSSERPVQRAMGQMIATRLSAGFQIIPLRKRKFGQIATDHFERMLLSLGNRYHEIRSLSDVEIQIIEYKQDSADSASDDMPLELEYSARFRPAISWKERIVHVDLSQRSTVYDWYQIDEQCNDGSLLTCDSEGICKVRFVLIPVESIRTEAQGGSSVRDSDEERRLDGINKLTQMWQRNRYFNESDQQHRTAMIKAKITGLSEQDQNPLAIEYLTRDSSDVVGAYGLNLAGFGDDNEFVTRLFSESEQYHTSDFDAAKLVKQLQEPAPDGVDIKDRKWWGRTHQMSFRGDEMINWLLRIFKDLQSRQDAVALGNQLMSRDLFTHVNGRHKFRDGHYLYRIKPAHRTTAYPESIGFFSRPIKPFGRSVPSTPVTEAKQPHDRPTSHAEHHPSGQQVSTPTQTPVDTVKRREILLSQRLQYNVDSGKKSAQLEVVNLHYDRIHNPENCYHIWLDWTSATPKLIRESVARWSATVESYGLKLVQLPLEEASKLHIQHPWDQPISVKLAVRPPDKPPTTPQLDPQPFSPRLSEQKDGYHKAILRRCGFVLDLESAYSFPKNVDVSFSWGRPDYRYTQFVHKSGQLLVQILNNDKFDFLILPNRLASNSGIATTKKSDSVSLESVVRDFVSFCRNEKILEGMYEESHRPKAAVPSPFANALAADNDVPPIELPPLVTHRALLRNAG